MIYVKTKVKKSDINKKGLFAGEFIPKGTIVANMAIDAEFISEKKYQEEQKKGNKLISFTGVRWIEKTFLYGTEIEKEDFINHSFTPCLIYQLGICFAKKDILKGKEITLDYRFWLAEKDFNSFKDKKTGKKVDGISPQKCLTESAKELLKIFKTK